MKITLVQDAIIVVSDLTKEQFCKAKKFCPDALTLYKKDEDSKSKEPVCSIMVGEDGSMNANGIIFDSVTDEGKLCLTLAGATGMCSGITAAEKKNIIVEEYSSLILNVNELEAQVLSVLEAKANEIETALNSVETVSI